jgi:hypothetical protein
MAAIKLVKGDNRPYIRLVLKDVDGNPIDLTDSTVRVYFREAGSTTVLSTILCTLIDGGVNGVITFNFPGNTLDVDPGLYEGEIEIDFGGETQTVYDVLKFNVRDQFA